MCAGDGHRQCHGMWRRLPYCNAPAAAGSLPSTKPNVNVPQVAHQETHGEFPASNVVRGLKKSISGTLRSRTPSALGPEHEASRIAGVHPCSRYDTSPYRLGRPEPTEHRVRCSEIAPDSSSSPKRRYLDYDARERRSAGHRSWMMRASSSRLDYRAKSLSSRPFSNRPRGANLLVEFQQFAGIVLP